jgi:hypothetical protein
MKSAIRNSPQAEIASCTRETEIPWKTILSTVYAEHPVYVVTSLNKSAERIMHCILNMSVKNQPMVND